MSGQQTPSLEEVNASLQKAWRRIRDLEDLHTADLSREQDDALVHIIGIVVNEALPQQAVGEIRTQVLRKLRKFEEMVVTRSGLPHSGTNAASAQIRMLRLFLQHLPK